MSKDFSTVKVIAFDVFGTVVDWHGSVSRENEGMHPGINGADVLLVAANDPALLASRLAALPAHEAEDLMSRLPP